MDEDGLHSQSSGYGAGMLAPCTSEACQHMLRRIMTLCLLGLVKDEGYTRHVWLL